jgi:predicted alpha/beta hydrolase
VSGGAATGERERLRAVTADGKGLAVERIPAAHGPIGAAFIGHAMMANRRSLDRPRGEGLASRLAAHGIEVYTADFRGHGESDPAPAWTYDDIVRRDIPALARLVGSRHPGLPIAGVGHSLGAHGLVAALADEKAALPPLAVAVSIAGNPWLRAFERSPLRWVEKRLWMAFFAGIARAAGRVPARALRYGSDDVSRAFAEDSARWTRTGRFTARDGTDYLAALERVETPVIAVFGAGDRLLCHPAAGERFHRRIVRAPLEIITAGRPLVPFEPGHMALVTDPRARPLWDEIARRMVRFMAAPRSA